MNSTRYMVDNNALMALGESRRASAFFREHCSIPEDVLHEARYASDHASLLGLKFEVTPAVIAYVRKVMASVEVGSTDLVDLYGFKGTADPVLIGSTLAALDDESNGLFPDKWVVVTRDGAVLAIAKRYGLATMLPEELRDEIDRIEAADWLEREGSSQDGRCTP